MAQLLYKTRAGSTPQGKPRVFFVCHSLDFCAYFEEISEEILKISNCAIYYSETEAAVDENFYLQLNQMQLVVMPITSRLLYMPNHAMDVVFPYAEEHHIPVLPLMQEKNLEVPFNKKFGDLQFLDKHNEDPSALPYSEKLKNYLEAVLVGDELAGKVRAAFDAYIFLSYRKKDRKYAQELMRLIHRSEFCRDIAIWYDEFLTPGENFNGAIQAALEKSSLFALAVTPNLVNEENYVMTTEYPAAREAGKPILAAELVATDKEALKKNYKNIPDCVNPRDHSALDASLVECLQQLAVRENDHDPQHNFFIGLAYLSGIDVEVDHERAVELITGAAEAGLTEAMKKLVSIYDTGEGVKRDYFTAIRWREKLAEQAKRDYEGSAEEDDGLRYFEILLEIENTWCDMGQMRKAAKVCQNMIDHAKHLTEVFGSVQTRRALAIAHEKVGSIHLSEKRMKDAETCYAQSLDILEQLEREESGFQTQRDLGNAYCNMGLVYLETGKGPVYVKTVDLEEAEAWFRKALVYREKLAQENADVLLELSETYLNLGECIVPHINVSSSLDIIKSSFEQAKEWYCKALEAREQLAQEYGAERYTNGISDCYKRLGNLCEKKYNLEDAIMWFRRDVEMLESVYERNQTLSSLRDVSNCCFELGNCFFKKKDFEVAKQWYKKSKDMLQRLIEETNSDIARLELAACYTQMGKVQLKEKEWFLASDYFSKSINMIRLVGDLNTNRDAQLSLVQTYKEWCELYVQIDSLRSLEYTCGQALDIVDQWVQRDRDEELLEEAARLCSKVGYFMKRRKYDKRKSEWWARERYYNGLKDLSKADKNSLDFLFTELPFPDEKPQTPRIKRDFSSLLDDLDDLFRDDYPNDN